jgi:hypothetical protein
MLHFRRISMIFTGLVMLQSLLFPQNISQTIRGSIIDTETKTPLLAATVAVYDESIPVAASITDDAGAFRIENVPVGRYSVVCSFIGYSQVVVPDVIVGSGKEVILPVEMEESPVEIEEVSIRASGKKGEALNKMAFVSARTFSVEESDRFAGSRGDPARMASNYAGVQGNDDSNNDLVIRGNSPLGVLWRCEGINIPGPNHFGVTGSTGGPVTILNNKVLASSDFMTGAFPAEYGNSNAGVFDLNMRNGNNERHEFSGQIGDLGAELMAEGPIRKEGRSSYLVAYRYNNLYLMKKLIYIEADVIRYQDLNFKLNLPTGNSGNLSLFGMGGIGYTEILASKQAEPREDKIYGSEGMDEHFKTAMGVTGLSYSRTLGTRSFIKLTLAASREHQDNHLDKVFRHITDGEFVVDSMRYSHNAYHSNQNKYSANLFWNRKMNRKLSLRTGLVFDIYQFDMLDSIFNEAYESYNNRLDHKGFAYLTQPYIQVKLNVSGKLTFHTGLHAQLLQLESNVSGSLEPRLGVNYRPGENNTFSYGTGLHSQMLPTYIYFGRLVNPEGEYGLPNQDLGFIRSFHQVLSWDHYFSSDLRIRAETYYQYLFEVPVELRTSSYSVLDEGHDMERFFPDTLVNEGNGRNYGVELTAEKFFSRSYYLMLTASLYDAKRSGSDGLNYDALYNGRYALNLLGSREFVWGARRDHAISVGGKITLAGGKRYTEIDTVASAIAGEAVYFDSARNFEQFNPYFRADIKLNYRINTGRITHEVGVDLVNITNRENALRQIYISGAEPPLDIKPQLDFMPIFYYRIDF